MERYSEIAIFESQFEQKLDYCSFTTISFETPKSPKINFFGESKSKSRLFRTREDLPMHLPGEQSGRPDLAQKVPRARQLAGIRYTLQ